MNKTAFLCDERCFWHTPAGAFAGVMEVGTWVEPSVAGGTPESPETKRRFKNLVEVSGLGEHLVISSAAPATTEQLRAVHPAAYLEDFKSVSDAGGGPFGFKSPAGPGTYEIAKLSAGLAIQALAMVMEGSVDNAYALCRPPGHHCLPDTAMGFCYLSNIAIAVEAAIKRFGLERVAVVDWDVHHGNGTQKVFYERSDVLTISLHQDGCFPPGYNGLEDRGAGDGLGFNVNIPLPPGSGEATYLRALERIVAPRLRAFRPQLIVVACGFDANAFDPLARMLLLSDSYRKMTESILALAAECCGGRTVLVHEGGYSEFYVPFCGMAAMEALSGIRTKVEDPEADFVRAQQPSGKFLAFLDQYVDGLAAELVR